MVNASIEQIARQNNLTVEELRSRLAADGVAFNSFREEIRDEITTQRLREREVDEKIVVLDSEIDAYLAEQAGFTGDETTEYHVAHILLPINTPDEDDAVRKQVIEKIVKYNLNVTQTEKLVSDILSKEERKKLTGERVKFINYKLYINTIKKAFMTIQEAEQEAKYFQEDKGDSIELKIVIPKKSAKNEVSA